MSLVRAVILACLATSLLASPARAQGFTSGSIFFEPDDPNAAVTQLGRFQLSTFLALWDYPAFALPAVTGLELDPAPSPLFILEYQVNDQISVGGWYNPFSGDFNGDLLRDLVGSRKLADVSIDYWDVYVMYRPTGSWAHGLSFQLGYAAQSLEIDWEPSLGEANFGFTRKSLNLWVHRALTIGSRRFGSTRRPIEVFGSFGHYFHKDFDRSLDLTLGASVPLTRNISFSTSVWFANLDDVKTRITAGLTGRF